MHTCVQITLRSERRNVLFSRFTRERGLAWYALALSGAVCKVKSNEKLSEGKKRRCMQAH